MQCSGIQCLCAPLTGEDLYICMWQVHTGGGTGTLDKVAGSHTRLAIYPTLAICH